MTCLSKELFAEGINGGKNVLEKKQFVERLHCLFWNPFVEGVECRWNWYTQEVELDHFIFTS